VIVDVIVLNGDFAGDFIVFVVVFDCRDDFGVLAGPPPAVEPAAALSHG
jgi:hypothetical protein